MLRDIDIAKYFIMKDEDGSVFNFNVITKNGRNFYEGNARLNKYLQLSQNVYIAKYGKPLFSGTFLAYDNGAVVKDVYNNYSMLTKMRLSVSLDKEVEDYLNAIYDILKEAPIDDLISISHEDPAWIEKSGNYYARNEIMDPLKFKDVYKKQYSNIIYYMEHLQHNE